MENYSNLHVVCLQIFESVSKTTSIFILPLFMARIAFSNLAGEGNKAFQAIKGALTYFILLTAFPLIIDILFSIPETYLPKYPGIASFTGNSPDWTSPGIIPFSVDKILEVLLAGLFWLAYYLHLFFMILMCSMAPLVFLSSTLLGFGMGLEIFLGLLIVGSSWPIIWYGFDQVHAGLVSTQSDEFGAKCLELLLTLFKGIAPVAFAGMAIKSPPGQAISKTAQAGISAGQWFIGKTVSIPKATSSSVLAGKRSTHISPRSKDTFNRFTSFTMDTNRLNKAKYQSQASKRKLAK